MRWQLDQKNKSDSKRKYGFKDTDPLASHSVSNRELWKSGGYQSSAKEKKDAKRQPTI